MLDRLRRAIDAALAALESRSGVEDPGEDLDRLLRRMRDELVEGRARLPALEQAIRRDEAALRREGERAEECARRAAQAASIGDAETRDVALRFEERHRAAAAVLARKLEAGRAELELERRTVVDMAEQLKGAIARRDALAARARRAGATGRLRGGRRGVLDEFDRLVERMEGAEAEGRASAEVEETLAGGASPEPPLDPAELAERQLRELKRRMAEEGDGR